MGENNTRMSSEDNNRSVVRRCSSQSRRNDPEVLERRRSVVYGGIDLRLKTDEEILNLRTMAEALKLDQMRRTCDDILWERKSEETAALLDPSTDESLKRKRLKQTSFFAGANKAGKLFSS